VQFQDVVWISAPNLMANSGGFALAKQRAVIPAVIPAEPYCTAGVHPRDELKSIISTDCHTAGPELQDPPNYPRIARICIPKWHWRQSSQYKKPFPYKNNLILFQDHDAQLTFITCCFPPPPMEQADILISTKDSEKKMDYVQPPRAKPAEQTDKTCAP